MQFHGTAQIPTDAAAMLDWGLDTPFMSQDRPPLAIAMTATVDGIRGIRRYRLVIAQKAKLRLSPEVATALASRLLIIVLLPVDSSRAPLIESSCMAMLRMVTDHPCGSVLPTMEIQCLSIRQRGTLLYFHQAISEKKIVAIPGIHYFDASSGRPSPQCP